jgi:hypothetical protein
MKNNDDSFLTSLLQYHTRLIDQQFVDGIITKIRTKNKFRLQIMIIALFLACSVATLLLINVTEELTFIKVLPSLSPYIITFFLLSVLGFGAWLTSDEF